MRRDVKINTNKLTSPREIAVIQMIGILDDITAPQLDEILKPLLEEEKAKDLIFDCLQLEYFNSTGLARLMYYALAKQKEGCNFKFVIDPKAFIYEIVDISGAVMVLEIYDSLEAALKSYPHQ